MAPTVPIDFVGQKESMKFGLSQSMGKSRKFSKGHSSDLIPDYMHAVVTTGESEGFGSSGRMEAEFTGSVDSYAPRMYCISLNVDGYESIGVPLQVVSLSKMSRFERKNLKLRLKNELEQVRNFQKKVASVSSAVVLLSPHSHIRSCSDGLKRPPLEGLHRPVESSVQHSKKRAPGGCNGARAKKAFSGHNDAVKPVSQATPTMPLLLKQCENLLIRLMTHQYAWVFNTPVDIVKLNIPDYFNIIKHPMDLGTVKSKITSGEYSSPLAFAADVRLTFSNAMKYNPPGNDVHIMADLLNKTFEARWKNIEKKLSVVRYDDSIPLPAGDGEIDTVMSAQPRKKKKITPSDQKGKAEPARQTMTVQQKHNLSVQLEALLAELPETIIDFLRDHSYNAGRENEDEIEIDIDVLGDDTLFKLRKLLDDYILEKKNSQVRGEPCEMELINVSGLSNSSLQPCKVEEDVDIVGGDDPPITRYLAVDIKKETLKETVHKLAKGSVSSSSSSESGSSSSDSDSGSSSGSERDAVKSSAPGTAIKVWIEQEMGIGTSVTQYSMESMAPEDIVDPKRGVVSDLESRNDGEARTEVNFQGKPSVAEADGHPEEESGPPERQVSPEKMYRAALLRNRFADTIFKARSKVLEKDEKLDPEQLQKEREDLERRQKEDKARLEEEAKAAEEARRKAEAEAAAEVKRKIEVKREAARQALQEMEKTVEINENRQLMEDLEMLRTRNEEQVGSFVEERRSPEDEHCLNGLGSFNLQSNPLEQLGLFMKEEEEEEEIGRKEEVAQVEMKMEQGQDQQGKHGRDVEEGEID
ncbi:Transcription factor GTE10 [Linum grandiflorum]